MDSPWHEDTNDDTYHSGTQWEKLSSDFTNAGYREGITAGKEGALQEGFDSGFAITGAPLGRELGRLRGISSCILALVNKGSLSCSEEILQEARTMASRLGEIRFSDIVPPDLEAEEHAREHTGNDGDDDMAVATPEELEVKKDVEVLEDMLSGLSTGNSTAGPNRRPTKEDLEAIGRRLQSLLELLTLQIILL